ncbi:phosphoribosylformylglycinamidine synthase [Marasmitruncus massiliensis]|uniref:phosphoribosylformylglycinamidine synthase n=1 Tax=Marasmitruncus massiliensis TaxID=1944642 RepID=UPI000C7B8CBA|nr:phosphoribosylformylglycinamidine synthase [Marasmitruncus massiliensis]
MSVYRIYVEKKPEFAVEASGVLSDLRTALMLDCVSGVRMINRYDVEHIDPLDFENARHTIFSEPQVDVTYDEFPEFGPGEKVFAVEYLPGQFDQRADSCAQCISLSTAKEQPVVRTARIFVLSGGISPETLDTIKHYLVNPVESRLASLEKPVTLDTRYEIPTEVETLVGFTALDEDGLSDFVRRCGLAMDTDDIAFCQRYFREEERRDPTITEIRMIDTYWSDHCRHTTFLTNLENVRIETPYIRDTYQKYLALRAGLYKGKDKPMTLMDLAVIGAKALKAEGMLPDLDESEEINACSVKITVDVDGHDEDWLLMFKNETHNHPTEIEPFGGAATCLGGAIRDPLSGRSYVYQAMRVTGAADPTVPLSQTLAGKLPQRKIVTTAAAGYSSYGNQIGLATGHVAEVYHPGYAAKRMEIGAVIGATPADHVVRECPDPGDIVVLLGGRTGRDGCGGATGSSKSHTLESLESCGAEVQKGNAPIERKLQRLFRNGEVTRLIKRCNDFGAGGVSVAIGELADGLEINLDAVPKKYDGLDGTELAISESQERMAVVVSPENADRFIAYAHKENLEATVVAKVTETPRLVMNWNGKRIVDLSRSFLNSNGAVKHTDVEIEAPRHFVRSHPEKTLREKWLAVMEGLNVCSQKGLVERFDSTIGAGTVLMPFGGKTQLSPAQAMAAKIPVLGGETTTASLMGWGFNPDLSQCSPYHGAMNAVIESVAKVVAAGGSSRKCWLTFQEYFERTKNDPKRWGKPMAALLGALEAQLSLGIGSIGGKDSMSGSFEDLDVPPTLVSFAVSVAHTGQIVSTEFKQAGHKVYLVTPGFNENRLPDFESVKHVFRLVESLTAEGKVAAAWTLGYGGVCEGITKMCLGNRLGFDFSATFDDTALFDPIYGGFLLEAKEELPGLPCIGTVSSSYAVKYGFDSIPLEEVQERWEKKLQKVFPYLLKPEKKDVPVYSHANSAKLTSGMKIAKPRVLIPVFPGTNCEYDTARAFRLAGAEPEIFVVRNLTASDIRESVDAFARSIQGSQIIALPGGFSGGDEPDGSGKFITAFLRNPRIRDEVHELLRNRDGLMCGICNGFQALIKLGLVPYGEIRDMDETCATLTFNTIGRHQSMLVRTRIASNKSPWLMNMRPGEIHTVAISHGEGRFVAPEALIRQLADNGQIATQYVDLDGQPSLDIRFNPNNSFDAIEGITSPDGRVLGKMGHSERTAPDLYQNVEGCKFQNLFGGAVDYFIK